jgi:centrosomal CEP192-like protein/beta-propeller repeat-containing protein
MKREKDPDRMDQWKLLLAGMIVSLLFLAASRPLKTYVLAPAAERIAPQTSNRDGASPRRGAPHRLEVAASRILVRGTQASQTSLVKSYGKLPLSFEPNRGQANSRVKFLSRHGGYSLYLTATEAVLGLSKARASIASKHAAASAALLARLPRPASLGRTGIRDALLIPFPELLSPPVTEFSNNSTLPRPVSAPRSLAEAPASLRMRLEGANPSPRLQALEKLPGKSNYFIGKDPKKWRTNVPNYAKVKYQDVYPGVDLVYYGNRGQLEYDFVVAPGADPRAIRMEIEGSKKVNLDDHGDLVVDMGDGEVRFHKPVVYQPVKSGQSAVASNQLRSATDDGPKGTYTQGEYVLEADNKVRFQVSPYDPTKPLIIDPVLKYSTYLGGSGDDTGANGMQNIAVDPAGNAYIGGVTDSSDFPVTAGAFQAEFAGGGPNTQCAIAGDAFVTKVNAQGDAVVYSTYLGGNSDDCGEGIAVDASGHAYIAGETLSTDFPVTAGVFQPACKSCSSGQADTFAAKLTPDGSALVYSTYIGGSGWDGVPMITVDRHDNMYIQGSTSSVDFPTTKGAFQTTCAACAKGSLNTYVTKLNADGTALVYSTYLGGSTEEVCGSQIAVDSEGSLYVDGIAFSPDFPTTPGAFQTSLVGSADAFVTKLNPAGTALAYSTLLGGSGIEFVSGIAVDDGGNAYVTGATSSTDFPTTPGALHITYEGGPEDAFVTKINPSGTSLVYSTYLGGTGDDVGAGMALDSDGNAYIGGFTSSTDFPTLQAFQLANAGGYDAFVTELNAAGDALVYSTYLGGSGSEFVGGIAFDSHRNVYIQGWTSSSDFLVVNPLQPQLGGGTFDALLAKISPDHAPGLGLSRLSVDFGTEKVGTTSPPQVVTVRNVGSQPLVVRGILAEPGTQFAQTNTCTSDLEPTESCTVNVTFTPAGFGETQGELIVVANSQPAARQVSLTGVGGASSAPAQATRSNSGSEPARPNQINPIWRKLAIVRRKASLTPRPESLSP